MNFTSREYDDHFEQLLRPPADGPTPPLRDYQRAAVDAVLPKLRKNGNPQLIHVATGGGKTRIGNEVAATRPAPSTVSSTATPTPNPCACSARANSVSL